MGSQNTKYLEIKEGEDLNVWTGSQTKDSDMKHKEGACPCGPDIYRKKNLDRLTKDATFL